MSIQLKDFINIRISRDTVISYGRNKTVAYISDGVKEEYIVTGKDNEGKFITTSRTALGGSLIYSSLDEVLNAKDVDGKAFLYDKDSDVSKACKIFFGCGGKSILLVKADWKETDSEYTKNSYLKQIQELPLEVIAFAMKPGEDNVASFGGFSPEYIPNLITTLDSISEEGTAYRKLAVINLSKESDIEKLNTSVNLIYKLVDNLVNIVESVSEHDYSFMSVLAYLSKIDLTNPATIADYCFTKEPTLTPVTNEAKLDWQVHGKVVNMVLDIFGGMPTNFGGNTSGGTDIVEEYMLTVISQDVLYAELSLLQSKLKASNAIGLVRSTIIGALEPYYKAGFLVQGIYEGPDIFVNTNNSSYKILSNGGVITGGYLINILPFNSRSQAEVAKRSLPDVHLILNTAKGIRYINNIGKIV